MNNYWIKTQSWLRFLQAQGKDEATKHPGWQPALDAGAGCIMLAFPAHWWKPEDVIAEATVELVMDVLAPKNKVQFRVPIFEWGHEHDEIPTEQEVRDLAIKIVDALS